MPARDPGGIVVTIVLGVVGAVVGGMLGRAPGLDSESGPLAGLGALTGSLPVLAIYGSAIPPVTHSPLTPEIWAL
jgi:uncharacterized membrane protein YeaQ/YmgE (transglycosylase-associated protein family)